MTPEEVNNRINRPESGLNSRFAHGTMLGLGHRRRRWMMTRYLAGVLTVIAVGTLLIAYGLLNPRFAAADGTSAARTFDAVRVPTAGDGVTLLDNGFRSPVARAYPVANRAVAPPLLTRDDRGYEATRPAAPVRSTRVVERAPKRDWKKTAMIVGGSSIAGAGLGAILGGRKGALIGAALGGGAATIYEVRR